MSVKKPLLDSIWHVATDDNELRVRVIPPNKRTEDVRDFGCASSRAVSYTHGGAIAVATMFTARGTPCHAVPIEPLAEK